MNEMAVAIVGSLSLALLTGWLGFAFGGRRERDKERRDRNLARRHRPSGAVRVQQAANTSRLDVNCVTGSPLKRRNDAVATSIRSPEVVTTRIEPGTPF